MAINVHADVQKLPNVLFEIRNDLISSPDEEKRIADMLVDCIKPLLANDDLYRLYEGEEIMYDPASAETYFEELIKKAKEGEAR